MALTAERFHVAQPELTACVCTAACDVFFRRERAFSTSAAVVVCVGYRKSFPPSTTKQCLGRDHLEMSGDDEETHTVEDTPGETVTAQRR